MNEYQNALEVAKRLWRFIPHGCGLRLAAANRFHVIEQTEAFSPSEAAAFAAKHSRLTVVFENELRESWSGELRRWGIGFRLSTRWTSGEHTARIRAAASVVSIALLKRYHGLDRLLIRSGSEPEAVYLVFADPNLVAHRLSVSIVIEERIRQTALGAIDYFTGDPEKYDIALTACVPFPGSLAELPDGIAALCFAEGRRAA